MHYLYFYIHKTDTKLSEQEIDQLDFAAESGLNDNSFANQEGYWASGKCDWFQIGGRWNTALKSLLKWGHPIHKEVSIRYGRNYEWDKATEEEKKEHEQIWKECEKELDIKRHTEMITRTLLHSLVKTYSEEHDDVECFLADEYDEVMLTKLEESLDVNDLEAGKYYMTIVDYHN